MFGDSSENLKKKINWPETKVQYVLHVLKIRCELLFSMAGHLEDLRLLQLHIQSQSL